MGFPSLLVFFFVFHLFLPVFCHSHCLKSCPCGNLSLEYPITKTGSPECGLIEIDCDSSSTPKLQLGDEGLKCDVMNIDFSSRKLIVRDNNLKHELNSRICPSSGAPPLSKFPYISFTISPNLTLVKCNKPLPDSTRVEEFFQGSENYHQGCEKFTLYYRNPAVGNLPRETDHLPFGRCHSIQLPLNPNGDWSDHDLFKLLTYDYTIQWHVSEYAPPEPPHEPLEPPHEPTKGKSKKKVILVAGLTAATLIVTVSTVLIVFFRKNVLKSLAFQKMYAKNQLDIELFLKNHGTLAPKTYKYSHLKKITNSFSEKLGKGGYGSVYKGKLQDGRLVAIKILSESKGNGEEFINEVSSISRTSHVNIVALLGFCFDSSKRALIYEFMPNGSLEKFIPNTSSSAPNYSLGADKLFEIVVGIAHGLEYLHQGCNTRILHFDIKHHNILLDKDLKPKISDFGLSKLCPNRSSIVSMQWARGTVGYIAPEVFCRNFGEVSHKSDVYSYGMMVLEMVVGRQRNIDHQGERSSEIYFSDWIYKNLEQNTIEEGILDNHDSQEDDVKRRLIIIGLWCIQTDPRNRPSISKVIEMLEAQLESLQLPPRQYVSSSPILPLIYSFSESESLI